MPYVGDVYQLPPGTPGTPNTTIESSKYNAFVADIATAQNTARPIVGGGTGGQTALGGNDGLNTKGADIASAATTNLAAATGVYVNVTGTTTINSFGTVAAGALRELTFTGILTLTYNATSMILPGAANVTTAAGDTATFRSLGGGNWKCVSYLRANGSVPGSTITGTTITNSTIVLKQSAVPVPTAEGDIQWDTDDDVIVVGDGATQKIFASLPAGSTAGDLLYLTSSKALARLPKGTAGQLLQMNTGATAPQWLTAPFTKAFESAQQTITAGGSLTLAHGLGVQPKLYQIYLIAQSAVLGYTSGDEVLVNPSFAASDPSGRGASIVPDAANINIRFGSDANSFTIIRKNNGDVSTITNANWKLVVRAWA
ncbi:hypothetical protein FJV76_14250 [Mesorhizobium sp. WSM4303]|uniref:hypothetical protein n=1 Tax=Mesorhizobium sp. WSM4303 TaxID=2589887 RepID=UPI00115DFDFD|nr:hypothetical protein [Mesorhizobium sp. WSM4303]TRD03795.1 hypothetical protein FJV76_14250 [Mesorhizobium sp. WSM4303]